MPIMPPVLCAVRAQEKREIALRLAATEGVITTNALAVRYGHGSSVAAHRLLKKMYEDGLLQRSLIGHKHLYHPTPQGLVEAIGDLRECSPPADMRLALLSLDLRVRVEAAGGTLEREGRRAVILTSAGARQRARLLPRMPTFEALVALADDPTIDILVFPEPHLCDAARRAARDARTQFFTPEDWRADL